MATTAKKPVKFNPLAQQRVSAILDGLERAYPEVRCALRHESAWQLLVATILSAQCTDARVNMVTPELFKKYPGPERLARVEPEDVEALIRSTGFSATRRRALWARRGGLCRSSVGRFRRRWRSC
jgi:endonuclease III